MKEIISCNGCTGCCEDFLLIDETFKETEEQYPDLLIPDDDQPIIGWNKVNCNALVPNEGCKNHPSIVDEEIRPKFCADVNPATCNRR